MHNNGALLLHKAALHMVVYSVFLQLESAQFPGKRVSWKGAQADTLRSMEISKGRGVAITYSSVYLFLSISPYSLLLADQILSRNP